MRYLACYGTLRKNAARNHNFGRFGEQKFVDSLWVQGFRMYSLGPYPAAVEAATHSIFVEIHELEDKVFDAIERMEQCAGYRTLDIYAKLNPGADHKEVIASIFVMDLPQDLQFLKTLRPIMSGDWNEQ